MGRRLSRTRILALASAGAVGAILILTAPLVVHLYEKFAEHVRTRPDPRLGTSGDQKQVLLALLENPPIPGPRLLVVPHGPTREAPPRSRVLLDQTVAFCDPGSIRAGCVAEADAAVLDVGLDGIFNRKLRLELLAANRTTVRVEVPSGIAIRPFPANDILPLLKPSRHSDECRSPVFPDSFDALQVSRAVFTHDGEHALIYFLRRTCDEPYDQASLHYFRRVGVRWENAGRVRLGLLERAAAVGP